MLILTRRSGESIRIGTKIKVQVVEVKGRQVRLGIDAPRDFSVHREEIFERIQNNQDSFPTSLPYRGEGRPDEEEDLDQRG